VGHMGGGPHMEVSKGSGGVVGEVVAVGQVN
jgi:hypothetical protein